MSEQRLGILGGMGPQATQDFYQRILDRTDASCDQEHLPTLIWSDTSMPDRTAAILGGDAEGCYRRLLDGASDPDKTYVEQVLPGKMAYNLQSLRDFSFWGEWKTMLHTVTAVLH